MGKTSALAKARTPSRSSRWAGVSANSNTAAPETSSICGLDNGFAADSDANRENPQSMLNSSGPRMTRVPTADLTPSEIAEIRDLLFAAFADDEHGAFTEEDWQHA